MNRGRRLANRGAIFESCAFITNIASILSGARFKINIKKLHRRFYQFNVNSFAVFVIIIRFLRIFKNV